MGKKKVTVKTKEEVIQEGQAVESAIAKASKGVKGTIDRGRVYVRSSYNNTSIVITNNKGDVLTWASAGSLGFNGPKKATPFAASKVVSALAEKIKKSGPFNVDVFLNGVGGGRDSAVRSLINHGFNIESIKDVTSIAHNGPRPKKVRRI